MRFSGMSRPCRARMPLRITNRSVVSTYRVVSHRRYGRIVSQSTTMIATPMRIHRSIVCPPPCGIAATPKPVSRLATNSTKTGTTRRPQCGCRSRTTSSPCDRFMPMHGMVACRCPSARDAAPQATLRPRHPPSARRPFHLTGGHPATPAGSGVRVRGDLELVGEHHRTSDEMRRVDGLELPHCGRLPVRFVSRRVGKGEQVYEAGRVALLLPSGVHVRPRLIFANVSNKFLDRFGHLAHRARLDLVVRCLVDGHVHLRVFSRYQAARECP